MNNKKEYKKGISVIIPTFNRAKYLYSTLICLCNQQVNETLEYEIIIIDSGDDETESVVRMFQNGGRVSIIYKRIKKCKNRSLLRNTGAALAKYDILCFLDNDMLTPPEFIQRHYDEHQNNEHTVLLGCRKSLTYFDITQIGEEALQTNFNILNQLPYYTDERIRMFNQNEPWRFVFSHTLSVAKEDFIKAGKFNVDFGEHWGYEDLELGFNLQLIGCDFLLITNQFDFHQPHFAQSNKEQHEMSHNAELFIKMHNCFECELYISFYTDFDEFYILFKELKKEFIIPDAVTQKKYDLIFGCLFSSNEAVSYKNMYLGVHCVEKDDSCRSLLIIDTFFKFPQIIQMSIISEAFRVSRCVCIESMNIDKIKEFERIAKAAGIIVEYKSCKNHIEFSKKEEVAGTVFTMILPDIFQPEKRYVYSWLALCMLKNGIYVNLRDLKKTEIIKFDDFSLPENSQQIIEDNIEKSLGETKQQFITSLAMLLLESNPFTPNNTQSFIFHDEDYLLKFNSLKYRQLNHCNHFDEALYSCISFLSVYNYCKQYKQKDDIKKGTFCCFMENGFKEDGIDVIIEAFNDYIKNDTNAFLSIKIPDYDSFYDVVYTLHNDVSKLNKLYAGNQKRTMDFIQLKSKISEYKLENNIKIIKKNYSINEVIDFIDQHNTFLFASRGCCISPQVYISLLLGKHTVIGKHHKILTCLLEYCDVIDSQAFEFADEMQLPKSCLNIPYVACRLNYKQLINGNYLGKMISEETTQSIVDEANKLINTFFCKNSFVEG